MPVAATGRSYVGDLVKGLDGFSDDSAINFNIASVTVGGTSTEFAPVGTPLVWDNGDSRFEVFGGQDISAVTGSPLPDGSPICIAVGEAFGYGFNKSDKDLTDGDITVTVLYRGDAGIVDEAMVWGSASGANQTLFKAQLQKQRITTVDKATVVTPSYTS